MHTYTRASVAFDECVQESDAGSVLSMLCESAANFGDPSECRAVACGISAKSSELSMNELLLDAA